MSAVRSEATRWAWGCPGHGAEAARKPGAHLPLAHIWQQTSLSVTMGASGHAPGVWRVEAGRMPSQPPRPEQPPQQRITQPLTPVVLWLAHPAQRCQPTLLRLRERSLRRHEPAGHRSGVRYTATFPSRSGATRGAERLTGGPTRSARASARAPAACHPRCPGHRHLGPERPE